MFINSLILETILGLFEFHQNLMQLLPHIEIIYHHYFLGLL